MLNIVNKTCSTAAHEALKLDPAAYCEATTPIAGILRDLVDDEFPVRLDFYSGSNCRSCGSTLFVLSASVEVSA